MFKLIDEIPYPALIAVTILMLAAPFQPIPHIVEKIMMLKDGTLQRPIDIFDLFFHMIPLVILIIKLARGRH